MNDKSQIISESLGILYPVLMLLAGYITLNGHLTPGGGFQGGAILSAIYIAKYLIGEGTESEIKSFQMTEKLVLVFIILLPIGYLYTGLYARYSAFSTVYMIGANLLIAAKVFCGLTILFLRFVHYEIR